MERAATPTEAQPGSGTRAGRSATVVVSQVVRPGKADEYAAWQQDVTETVGDFPGFQGTEVFPPVAGVQDEWVVLYRFDTSEHLLGWMNSDAREAVLDRGRDLLQSPATQQVLAGGTEAPRAVTAVVSHHVRPDQERDFLKMQARMEAAQRTFPGYQGSETFRPIEGIQDDWTIVFRFDSRENLERWMQSPERRDLLQESAKFSDYQVRTVGSSFGSWFRFESTDDAPTTPNWKQAMSVLLALYPTVMVLTLTTGRWMNDAGVPVWLAMFVGNVLSVAALTWLAMPAVTRVLRVWLRPHVSRRIQALGVAAVVAGYGLSLLVFALI